MTGYPDVYSLYGLGEYPAYGLPGVAKTAGGIAVYYSDPESMIEGGDAAASVADAVAD